MLGQRFRRCPNIETMLDQCVLLTWLKFVVLILDNYVKKKKYGNFVSISSLTGKCAAQKIKNVRGSSLLTCSHHMVILRSQNEVTDFFLILGWVWAFNVHDHNFLLIDKVY